MTYLVITLPSDTAARTDRVAFERAQGGRVYQRPDGSHVLARETWPPPAPARPALPDPLPADWTEITS